MHRGGTYSRTQGRQFKQRNLNICNRKIYLRWRIKTIIWTARRLCPFSLPFSSCCHGSTRHRTSVPLLPSSAQRSPAQPAQGLLPGCRGAQGKGETEMPRAGGNSLLHSLQLLLQLFTAFPSVSPSWLPILITVQRRALLLWLCLLTAGSWRELISQNSTAALLEKRYSRRE